MKQFYSQELFFSKNTRKISFLEIARVLGVSKRIPKSNIKEATKFYSEVMGWYVIMEPSTIKKEAETAIGQQLIVFTV